MENYEPLQVVGSGSFGVIRKVRRKSDGKVLVRKEIDYRRMSIAEKKQLVAEVNILRELRHPNIVQYYERFVDKEMLLIYIIMEYCEGGDLAAIIKRCKKVGKLIAEDLVWILFSQLVLALDACHRCSVNLNGEKKGVVLHRDIKPENVFLDDGDTVKLGDFGLSRVLDHPETGFARTFVGTPYYMSPEIVRESTYNTKSDVWALVMMCRPPFQAATQQDLNDRIKSGRVSRLPSAYSEELNSVVRAMLHVHQEKRPSTADLLQHPRIHSTLLRRESDRMKNELRQKESQLSSQSQEFARKVAELQRKEMILEQREILVKKRELAVEQREAELSIREKHWNAVSATLRAKPAGKDELSSSSSSAQPKGTPMRNSSMPPPPPPPPRSRTQPATPSAGPRPISVDSTPYQEVPTGSPMILSTPNVNVPTSRSPAASLQSRTQSGLSSMDCTPSRPTPPPLYNFQKYRSPLALVQTPLSTPRSVKKALFQSPRSPLSSHSENFENRENIQSGGASSVDDATLDKLGAWLDNVHIQSTDRTPAKTARRY